MALDVADSDVVRSKLMEALLSKEEKERYLVLVLRCKVELPREVMGYLLGVKPVGKKGGVPSHRSRKGGLGDVMA